MRDRWMDPLHDPSAEESFAAHHLFCAAAPEVGVTADTV
jgi:hypothetical protein